jgi:hypothetical protein
VGDTIRLYSTRNFESVMQAYKATEKPVVREAFAEAWGIAAKVLGRDWEKDGENFSVKAEELIEAYEALHEIFTDEIREPERELIEALLLGLCTYPADNGAFTAVFFEASSPNFCFFSLLFSILVFIFFTVLLLFDTLLVNNKSHDNHSVGILFS